MPTLYVTEPGSVVRRRAGSLVVTLDEDPDGKGPEPERRRILAEIEPHRLEMIALVGRTHITSEATRFCLRNGIALAWFRWNGEFLGRTVPDRPRSADLRLLQYAEANDKARANRRARNVVRAKIGNAMGVLRGVQSNYSGDERLAGAIRDLDKARDSIDGKVSTESLMGFEGAAAQTYFSALGGAFRGDIEFSGRQRRPPPDPANALLSFGYVLLVNLISGRIEARGLDPAIGFYHGLRPGRPSLSLDLLEELRHPVVDRFVMRACNLRIMRPEMFETDPDRSDGVQMTRDGIRRFFREWERYLKRPMREVGDDNRISALPLVERQINRLAADLRGGPPYQPFQCDR